MIDMTEALCLKCGEKIGRSSTMLFDEGAYHFNCWYHAKTRDIPTFKDMDRRIEALESAQSKGVSVFVSDQVTARIDSLGEIASELHDRLTVVEHTPGRRAQQPKQSEIDVERLKDNIRAASKWANAAGPYEEIETFLFQCRQILGMEE